MDQHSFLLNRMSLVGGEGSSYNGLETNIEYDTTAFSQDEAYPYFFEWNEASHLSFPPLNFDEEHVPLGDSVHMCLGLEWTTTKKRNQYDKYLEVKGLDQCEYIRKGHTRVEAEYPKRGLNFKMWVQHNTKGDTTCHDGIYSPKQDTCYTYEVMK